MSIILLNTPSDVDWIYDTHLKNVSDKPERSKVAAAAIEGNPDCPNIIDLYASDPLVTDKPVASFRPDEDLNYVRK